ncbi:sugar transferase [Nodosilinea sp. E11]|uniref:sugar transferase n=1 Tax=Nodosilinea sp. E11 TaxID=3037479 RepID=UPI002934970B|nr:sugar transferase [Nodosilinea sp. E11]WOD37420.1 sugar transferase [Nodosilinea sp. E11]
MAPVIHCHRAVPAVMQQRPHHRRDIRAPRGLRFQLRDAFTGTGRRGLVLLATDSLALGLSWYIARSLNQFFSPIPPQLVWWTWLGLPSPFWVLVVCTVGLFAYGGLYDTKFQGQKHLRAGKLLSLVYLGSLVLMYFYDPKLDLPRSLFFSAWLSGVGLVVGLRLMATLLLSPFPQTKQPTSVFLIAPAPQIKRLADVLSQRAQLPVIGAALATTANSPTTYDAIVASGATLVLAESIPSADLASELYWKLRRAGIAMQLIPTSRDMLYRRGTPETVAGLPTLRLDAPLMGGWDYRFKRWMDYLGAGLGAIALAPVLAGIALAIRFDSAGPIFFRQERVGLHGKTFQVWKFRTMVVDAPRLQAELEQHNESADGVLFKVKYDPRITRVGRLLRRTSLDELPQLFNVLCGQMSLVGPRPLPVRDVAKFDGWHNIRHQVLPGVTGLWQISGRSDIDTFDDVARLDLHYIDNWSLNLDLEILTATLGIVLWGKGAY